MIYRKERLNVPPFSWWTNRGKTKTFICCWSGSCKFNPDLIAATFLEVGKDYCPHAFELDGEDLVRYIEEGNLVRIVPPTPNPA